MLVVWVGLSLCWALVTPKEPAEEKQLSRAKALVKEPRGLIGDGGRWDTEMSDEPVEVTVEEKSKAKKKKSPEEIEAGKLELKRKMHVSFPDLSWPLMLLEVPLTALKE